MHGKLSPRLAEIVEALPLRPDSRIIEIGCGPGAAAREIARRLISGRILAIDRSATAIAQAVAASGQEIAAYRLEFRQVAAEEFFLHSGEEPYDFAFAVRVGAFDGRHPAAGALAAPRIRAALKAGGKLFIDGGNPLREFVL